MARLSKSRPAPAQSGVLRTVDVYHSLADVILTPVSSFQTLGLLRGGQHIANQFPVGSNGPTGLAVNAQVGRPHIHYGPGVLIRDSYCTITPTIRIVRPTQDDFNPFAVWEVEADLIFRLPAGAIANDFGLVLHCDTYITGWGNDFTNPTLGGSTIGKQGVAIMTLGATNEINCIARSTATGGWTVTEPTGIIAQPPGGPLGENDRVRRVKIRLESATVDDDAQCTWFVDGVAQLSLPFLAAAGMPDASIIAAGVQWMCAFRPFIRNGGNNASQAIISFCHWRVSAAPSVAAMEA